MSLLGLLKAVLGLTPPAGQAPVCAGCGKRISGLYLEAQGRLWHRNHFCCALCGDALNGTYRVGPHGEAFCKHHPDQEAYCHGCGAVTPGGLNGEGFCPGCAGQVLQEGPPAQELLAEVQACLRGQGLPWWPQSFPVRLVSRQELRSQPGIGSDSLRGLIHQRLQVDARGQTARQITGIHLLCAQPTVLQGSVLAHELGHAWVFQRGLELPREVEEGFCEFCSHLWLSRSRDPRAVFLMKRIASNTQPIYGDGFRKVQSWSTGAGFAGVLQQLERNARKVS